MNLPLDVETVIICDDIRQERNGKYLLIGVYGGNIVVGGFPADIVLAIWLLAQPKSVGQHQIKIRVVGPQNSTLVEGTLEVDLNDMNKAAIFALPGMPIQLQREGKLRFELAPVGSEFWTSIKTMGVELTPRKSAAPA